MKISTQLFGRSWSAELSLTWLPFARWMFGTLMTRARFVPADPGRRIYSPPKKRGPAVAPSFSDSLFHHHAMNSFQNQHGAVPALCGRCLFRNHCLTIRLLGLPCGRDVAGCFAGCSGLLMVTHGQLEVDTAGRRRVLGEGEAWVLPSDEPFQLWVHETTDVVFFERRK